MIYGQSFHYGFVFDDYMFIVNNPDIKSFGLVHFIWHFFPMTRSIGFYSFALNYSLNQYSPQGYHIFNFIVHLIAVGLVWALADVLLKITKFSEKKNSEEIPFIIAVLFLVHPCQTEAVTYISQRFESMATVFYLGSVYCYLQARLLKKWGYRIILFMVSGLLALGGIFTKEVAITIPAMILASEWILFPVPNSVIPAKAGIHNKLIRYRYFILFIFGALLYLLFSTLLHTGLDIFFQTMHSESHDGDLLTPGGYFLTQGRVFLTFMRLLVLPIHQNLDYDFPASTGLLHPPLTMVGFLLMSSMIYLVFKLRQSSPLIAFGLAWILITFSINLAPRVNVIFEHKLYLISFGFLLALVVFLFRWVHDRKVLLLILLGMCVLLSILSYERNKVWENGLTLWNDAVLKSPHKARAYNNLAYEFYKQGNVMQAIAYYDKALKLDPNVAMAYNNRGFAYYSQGRLFQAFADYNRSIEINPDFSKVYFNRALIYVNQSKFIQAISDFNKANAIEPQTDTYYNLGLAYFDQGKISQAIFDYDQALQLDPSDADAYNNRGLAYYNQGNLPQAMADYNKAIGLNSNLEEAFFNRALTECQLGKEPQAIIDFNKAAVLEPDHAQTYYNLGLVYYNLGKFSQAITNYDKAIALNPNNVIVYKYRGKAYYALGQWSQALLDYNNAIELNPMDEELYNDRGDVYMQLNKHAQARSDYNKAISINPNVKVSGHYGAS